jgi:hypothetical protein
VRSYLISQKFHDNNKKKLVTVQQTNSNLKKHVSPLIVLRDNLEEINHRCTQGGEGDEKAPPQANFQKTCEKKQLNKSKIVGPP